MLEHNRRQNELRHFAQNWAFLRFINFKRRKLHLQPAIDASRIYHQRTAKAETTNRSFLDVIFMSEKTPMGTVQNVF